jgi:carbonic anhydrase
MHESGTDSALSRRSFLGLSGAVLVAGVAGSCSNGDSDEEETVSDVPVKNGEDAWLRLVEGNKRFVDNDLDHPRRDTVRRAAQAEKQTPFAIVVGCSDSRVPPEIVFDEGIGDLFPVRVAGNTATDDIVLGSIEYGAAILNCVLLVVLGHEECGAVKAAVDLVTKGTAVPGHINGVVEPIVPAVEAVRAGPDADIVHAAMRENVRRQVELLRTSQPILAPLVEQRKLNVVGAEYALRTGAVERLA